MDEKEIAVAANFYCNRRRRELGAKKKTPRLCTVYSCVWVYKTRQDLDDERRLTIGAHIYSTRAPRGGQDIFNFFKLLKYVQDLSTVVSP